MKNITIYLSTTSSFIISLLVSILILVLALLHISGYAARLNTALQFGGNYARVKRLIEKGADVNAARDDYEGSTALMYASRKKHTEIVKLLREVGAE